MERVLEEIEILLPVLGFDVLQPTVGDQFLPLGTVQAAPTFFADVKKAKARAVERGGEFVVLAGSTALRRESASIPQSIKNSRKALIDAGILVPDDANADLYRFAQDASFGSPSGASGTMAGRSDNGHLTWHVEGSGQTYAAWRSGVIGEGGAS